MGAELETEVSTFAAKAFHDPVTEKHLTDKMVNYSNTTHVNLDSIKECPETIWFGPQVVARNVVHDSLLVQRFQDLQSSHAKQDPASPVGRTPTD